jgi:hypothetical protein
MLAPVASEPRHIAPSVVSRAHWEADPPRDRYVPLGPLRSIVLHHTSWPSHQLGGAGFAEEASYVRAIQRSHIDREFIDIGYHFVIMPSGRIFAGRPPSAMGAHVKGHNGGTVGISLAGDFDVEEPTASALAGLDVLIRKLAKPSAGLMLVTHRDLASTSCPGERLYSRVLAARAADGDLDERRK